MRGEVEAIVGRFGILANNDVLEPGCIREGKAVHLSLLGHEVLRGGPPVGFGTIHRLDDLLIFRGRYYMDEPRGRFAHRMVERLAQLARWSIGYEVLDNDLRARAHFCPGDSGLVTIVTRCWPTEVSPVLTPADHQTRTLRCGAYVASELRQGPIGSAHAG